MPEPRTQKALDAPALRAAAFAMRVLLTLLLAAPLLLDASAADAQSVRPPASAEVDPGPPNTLGDQSRSDIWRQIRHGEAGLSSSQRAEDGVLVNAEGEWWSQLRQTDGPLITYGGYGLVGVVAAAALFFLIRGPIRIEGGRSGRKVPRFSLAQRVAHWVAAVLFMILALTGLILLFGRPLLIPLFGHDVFSVLATASMQAHNLFGPVFIISLLALFLTFVRGNFLERADIGWVVRGGGLLGPHARAGRYNFGEKLWFWTAVFAGLALSATGLLLSFPDDLGYRDMLHLSQVVHAAAALVFIGFSIGHIYLGAIGTEGAFEGMVDGDVDENWARMHHDVWLEKLQNAGKGPQS